MLTTPQGSGHCCVRHEHTQSKSIPKMGLWTVRTHYQEKREERRGNSNTNKLLYIKQIGHSLYCDLCQQVRQGKSFQYQGGFMRTFGTRSWEKNQLQHSARVMVVTLEHRTAQKALQVLSTLWEPKTFSSCKLLAGLRLTQLPVLWLESKWKTHP